jgi:multidrug efflux pump subunit AcrA (membrane-fusion protein)
MALLGKVANLDNIPEALKSHYVARGDHYVLDVEDMADKSKLNEFRDTNVKLMKDLKEAQATLNGVNLEEYNALKTQAQKLKEKKLLDADKFEELFNERLAPLKSEKERIEKDLSSKLAARDSQLSKLLIDNEIRAVAAKSGVRSTAVDDLILRGHQVFKFENDKVVPMSGDQIAYGKDGEPLSITEWVGSLSDKAPHLFEASQGSGAAKAGASMQSGGNRIARDDKSSFAANIDAIASGQKIVV